TTRPSSAPARGRARGEAKKSRGAAIAGPGGAIRGTLREAGRARESPDLPPALAPPARRWDNGAPSAMSGFSIPLSQLCVSTMTTMVLAPSATPADAVVAVPPQIPDQGLIAEVPPTFLSGFRVEGSPEVEVV